jgi:hypothetical protein
MRVTIERFTRTVCLLGLLAACAQEAPPPSVTAFMEDPILLDATMVRCTQNRAEKKYEPECVNAREAVDRLAVAAERSRRERLDAQFERKRQALRRAQEAAAEARRRAAEAEAERQQAEYLFGGTPEVGTGGTSDVGTGVTPGIAAGAPPEVAAGTTPGIAAGTDGQEAAPGGAPPATSPIAVPGEEPAAASGTGLEAVREALQERQEAAQQ